MTAPRLNPISSASSTPWWRVAMVWLVIAGPMSVVVASVASAVLAWHAIDPVIVRTDATATAAAQTDPKSPMAPALRGRNHAATPVAD